MTPDAPNMTRIVRVDPRSPDAGTIADAAALIRRGELVAFPTETVYGLAANALDPAAVEKIYIAKGRPPKNPLIVHIADLATAHTLTRNWPAIADDLTNRFWPGPLTIVLPRSALIPDIVTAGGETVGLRMPAHPVALALLRAAGVPLAAPSANRSSHISPTRAAHVQRSLGGRIPLILDAGPTAGGIESTVIDLTTSPPRILRPGLITAAQLGVSAPESPSMANPADPVRSPGVIGRHYAPAARVLLIDPSNPREFDVARAAAKRIGRMHFAVVTSSTDALAIAMPIDPIAYAARLYDALHTLDQAGCDLILIDSPPDTDAWSAVLDRIRRAAM